MTDFRPPTTQSPEVSLRRLGLGLFLVSIGKSSVQSAVAGVLVAAKLNFIAGKSDRISLVALIAVVSGIASLFAAVFSGNLSDRTRSRWGMRSPWIVGGGIVCTLALLAMAVAQSVFMLLVATSVVMMAFSAQLVATTAVIPDRVPEAQRGSLNAALGVGQLIGLALGLIISSPFIGNPGKGALCIAVVPTLAGLIFVMAAREQSNKDVPRLPADTAAVLKSLLPPIAALDFYWAVSARFFIVLGTAMLLSYQLYIVTDYLRQDQAGAAMTLSQSAVAYVAGAIIGGALGGPISDRFRRRKPLTYLSSFLIGASILLLLGWAGPWAMIGYKAVNGFGYGIYLAVHGALATEVLPNPKTRGKDLGFLTVANTLGGIFAPMLTAMAVRLGGYPSMFALAAFLCIGSALLIVPIRSVR